MDLQLDHLGDLHQDSTVAICKDNAGGNAIREDTAGDNNCVDLHQTAGQYYGHADVAGCGKTTITSRTDDSHVRILSHTAAGSYAQSAAPVPDVAALVAEPQFVVEGNSADARDTSLPPNPKGRLADRLSEGDRTSGSNVPCDQYAGHPPEVATFFFRESGRTRGKGKGKHSKC